VRKGDVQGASGARATTHAGRRRSRTAFLYLDELHILHGFPWSGTLDHGKERVNLISFPGLRARLSEEIPSPTLEHRDRTVS
jgi:hypothetical protein